jgi:hypothetical protein
MKAMQGTLYLKKREILNIHVGSSQILKKIPLMCEVRYSNLELTINDSTKSVKN